MIADNVIACRRRARRGDAGRRDGQHSGPKLRRRRGRHSGRPGHSGGRHGNVLDGNIVTQMGTGIWFTQAGNFYGGNRVSAQTPFVGADGQADWGGNVGF